MIKAILFDCYGTLIDTGNGSIEATERILARNQCNLDPRKFYDEWKRLHRDICSASPFKSEAEVFKEGLEILYKLYAIDGDPEQDVRIMLDTLGRRTAFPEVSGVLDQLLGKYRLGIGSNSDHEPLMADLTRNQVNIGTIYSSESLRVYKPNKRFFESILSNWSLQPEEVIYVGDSQIDDIRGPSEAGLPCIWINRKNEKRGKGIPEPKAECMDLTGIIKVLD